MIRFDTYTSPIIYEGMQVEALYIPMRDGVRLAVDLHLPANLSPQDRLPAIVVATRYWRKLDVRRGFAWLEAGTTKAMQFFVERGYAVLSVDVRGTGASFGTRRHEWDVEEVKDGYDIAEWLVAQSWSNGRIGAYGTSYSGTTAELFTVPNHPAVKAVLPRFNEFDLYTDISFPGGLYLRGFVEAWGSANAHLDANRLPPERYSRLERLLLPLIMRGVKPVDADNDRALLRQAVTEHRTNHQANILSEGIECRDDVHEKTGISVDDFSVHRYRSQIEASDAVIYGWGGWFDAGTANAVIHRFLTFGNRQVAVIGAWNHGAGQHVSPYAPRQEDVTRHWHEALRFFDHYLKDEMTSIAEDVQERTLYYYTLGEEAWKRTSTWPPSEVQHEAWYFAEAHALTPSAPESDAGEDAYTVDFTTTTGRSNRWYTQMGASPVHYPNRATEDERLLCYTSAPLERDVEITGYPVAHLHLASTHTDGAIFVYLEDVAPDGHVHYLTEGVLRLAHRHISADAPYVHPAPYHSFLRQDMKPLTPHEVAEVRLGLYPISVRIGKGHRIRIAIAGADHDLFPRLPEEGTPTLTVQRNQRWASHVILPMMPL